MSSFEWSRKIETHDPREPGHFSPPWNGHYSIYPRRLTDVHYSNGRLSSRKLKTESNLTVLENVTWITKRHNKSRTVYRSPKRVRTQLRDDGDTLAALLAASVGARSTGDHIRAATCVFVRRDLRRSRYCRLTSRWWRYM